MTNNGIEKLLQQWEKIHFQQHSQLINFHNSVKVLAPLIKLQEKFEKIQIPPNLALYTKQFEMFGNSFNRIASPTLPKLIQSHLELQQSFIDLPPRIQEALLLLAKRGWYYDFNMTLSDLWELRKAIIDENNEEVDEALIEYFDEKIEEVRTSLKMLFPERAHIISAAIDAHIRGEYYLAIPILLAQTDGICKEMVNQYLFMKKDKKPKTAIYVDKFKTDTCKAAFLSPLATTTPVGESEYERKESGGGNSFNRHMILHGESLDYGKKVNSVKAISLINYVSQALKKHNKENTNI